MTTRARRYLHVYDAFQIIDTEANLGSGKTITAYFAESRKSNATAIASTTETTTGSGGLYAITYARSALQAALGGYIGKSVFLHLDDGAVTHDVWEFVVTDTDPALLPPLL
jgi:hypothetical protein